MLRIGTPLLSLLMLTACSGGSEGETESEGGEASSTASGSDSETETSATGTETGATGEETVGEVTGEPGGDLRGLLNFTYYSADAATDEPLLGVAGAYREETFAIDDIYALIGLQLHFQAPPEALDTVVEYAPLPFVWGLSSSWIAAGNGVRFSSADAGSGLACLTMADDAYPLYLAAESDALDPECAPDPTTWAPGTTYDLTLYGGELFEDAHFAGAVTTPAALEISAPDLSVYNLEVDTKVTLDLAWAAGDAPEARIVIRLWDQYGQGLVASAADDGSFSIPAGNLAALSGGPGFLTVTRERSHTINFSAGSVDALTRYETWGYVDLLE